MASFASLAPPPSPPRYSGAPIGRSKGHHRPAPTPSQHLVPIPLLSSFPRSFRSRSRLIPPAVCSASEGIMCSIQQFATKRRNLLLTMFLASVSLPLVATDASADTELEESFQTYKDEVNKFRMSIPKDWLIGTGDSDGNSLKSVTAFYPNEASGSNVSVVITGLGPDFTRLQSFGNVDAFAETLVSGLDRSWRNPPGVAAKLIDSKAANGLYYIEYTLQIPGEKRRHILTALGVASNGWYNRLYTVTGQYMEDEAEKYQPSIAKTVSSFRFI
ncbi:psbP domain-containing protein 3, chloroplastic-like isoform X1 [Zingiber officinale]|uniref:psbP domain-containing protein 3, chloroplastic-like isoform X1 n=1 Tax=Zingiber officinale TaxID=94328 RepID=UPI001C4C90A0|nr:psbP domain-containing protein 3, chloroplastic-like isoform X1 [Zingiber officinale]